MRRFKYLLTSEFKLALTAIPIQVIAIIQPTILFLLMSAILVKPTFDMNIRMNDEPFTKDLVQAMQTIGSPIGETYINPILITDNMEANFQQIIRVENRDDHAVAIQDFGYIDSNLLKNYRNRLTAAGLTIWNRDLGNTAIEVNEIPLLPSDVPFGVYFGMGLLPTAVFIAAIFTGSVLTGQDF